MNELRPFFSYYGGKWSLAKRYPEPEHDIIIEPFAGSAGYSLRYPDRRVVLIEKNPKVAAIWRYLISADPERILALPDVDERGVDVLEVSDAERWLIGFWLHRVSDRPGRKPSNWMRRNPDDDPKKGMLWGPRCRERIASQVVSIRHWIIIEGDYTNAPDAEATHFIDPPYNNIAGSHYPCGPKDIDFDALGSWCSTRRGLVIVCENDGASWLPFRPFARTMGSTTGTGARRVSAEVVYIQGRTRGQREMFMEEM